MPAQFGGVPIGGMQYNGVTIGEARMNGQVVYRWTPPRYVLNQSGGETEKITTLNWETIDFVVLPTSTPVSETQGTWSVTFRNTMQYEYGVRVLLNGSVIATHSITASVGSPGTLTVTVPPTRVKGGDRLDFQALQNYRYSLSTSGIILSRTITLS